MAKYLGIPLTVSNGNKVPLTAQPELISNNEFSVSGTLTTTSWELGWESSDTDGSNISGGIFSLINDDDSDFDGRAWATNGVDARLALEQNQAYELTYTIAENSNNASLNIYYGDFSGAQPNTVGTHTVKFVQNGSASTMFILRNATNNTTIKFSSVFLKEIAATETPTYGSPEFVTNGNFETDSDWVKPAGWSILNGKANYDGTGAQFSKFYQVLDTVVGRKYKLTFTLSGISANSMNFGFGSSGGSFIEPQESFSTNGTYTRIMVADRTDHSIVLQNNTATQTFSVDNVSVKEVSANYLQVSDGGFKKSVKEGDVVFNTSTGTEGVVKEVVDNNVLLMSNDNFSTANEFFNVFAANGDTRGNQLIKTDNYIMSEYDENISNPQESSFWFAGGKNSDKVVLTQLNSATNTFFVAGVIEEYLERLNSQSATDSRLDIPLDAFRDHQYNETLTTTAITLS